MEDAKPRPNAGLAVRLTAVAAAYAVMLVCSLTTGPYTPWVVVIFAAVSMLNRYASYCVVWRVVRDTVGERGRPNAAVTAVVVANLFLSLAVIVPWLVRAADESNGDVFSVGAACVTIATCCWVARATCQLMFGIHRWSWAAGDLAYPWMSVHTVEDDDEGDTETAERSDDPLAWYLLSKCNDTADEYYRQTTDLIAMVHQARAKLHAGGTDEEMVTAVYRVAAAASRRRDLAVEGERLAADLRDQQPHADGAIDEPWNSTGADTLIAEAWDLAAGAHGNESPVLRWLEGRVDELLGTAATDSPGDGSVGADDRINPQDTN